MSFNVLQLSVNTMELEHSIPDIFCDPRADIIQLDGPIQPTRGNTPSRGEGHLLTRGMISDTLEMHY